MTLLTRLKLGLGLWFIVIAPILVGILYASSSDLDYLDIFLLLLISMGCCGVFSCLLHYMLPRKRPAQVEVVDGDNNSNSTKHRIGCLIPSSLTSTTTTTTAADSKKSGGDINSNSAIGISSSVVEPMLPNMALGDGNSHDIDEDLHSRQLAVYGRETMRRLFASNVLVSGMQGLGAEIGMELRISNVKSSIPYLLFPTGFISICGRMLFKFHQRGNMSSSIGGR